MMRGFEPHFQQTKNINKEKNKNKAYLTVHSKVDKKIPAKKANHVSNSKPNRTKDTSKCNYAES